MKLLIMGILAAWAMAAAAHADQMRLAVTTSFYNSGLADVLLPEIKADLDLEVQLLVVGTGQALRLGAAGDVDAILVHSRAAEQAFVAAGDGTHRREIMYNDFIFIGPRTDPAGIAQAQNALQGLQAIASAKALFISRGDDSGTHKKELDLWAEAQVHPSGAWYRSVGAGMGAALNIAAGLDAYILSDRASWLNFGNKGTLKLLFADDPVLFNQYTFLPVNAARHPHINKDAAQELESWLTSHRAQKLIDGYRINGQVLFTFNAQ